MNRETFFDERLHRFDMIPRGRQHDLLVVLPRRCGIETLHSEIELQGHSIYAGRAASQQPSLGRKNDRFKQKALYTDPNRISSAERTG